jgi:hypothetical protein
MTQKQTVHDNLSSQLDYNTLVDFACGAKVFSFLQFVSRNIFSWKTFQQKYLPKTKLFQHNENFKKDILRTMFPQKLDKEVKILGNFMFMRWPEII